MKDSQEQEPKPEQEALKELEQRAQTWIERAARRLDQEAQMEAEIASLFPHYDRDTEEAEPKISEQDQEFMAMMKDNWWRIYPHLGNLEFELELLMRDAPERSEEFFFDRQYTALQEVWIVGKAEQERAADAAAEKS